MEEGFCLDIPQFGVWTAEGVPFMGFNHEDAFFLRMHPLTSGELNVAVPVVPSAAIYVRGRKNKYPDTFFGGLRKGRNKMMLTFAPLSGREYAHMLTSVFLLPPEYMRMAATLLAAGLTGVPGLPWSIAHQFRKAQ